MPRVTPIVLLALSMFLPGAAAQGAGKNLAFRKPYTLSSPNYLHCTEPGDRTQLTDGVYSKGYFWTQKSTVGWGGGKTALITIDLGKAHPIEGMSFSTAAGVAGVQWPAELMVFVSDDGRGWFPVGDLVRLSAREAKPPMGKYANHVFRAGGLKAHGRFVAIAATPKGPYLFVDEIEVLEGDRALLGQPRKGRAVDSVEAYVKERRFTSLVQAQLRRDLAVLRSVGSYQPSRPERCPGRHPGAGFSGAG